MKKGIAILLVLCVAASLFAGVTVKAGFDFGTVSTKAKKVDAKEITFKTHGVGFDVAVVGDVKDNIAAYGDFSAIFPIFVKSSENDAAEITYVKGDVTSPIVDGTTCKFPAIKVSSVALRAGALYKMNVEGVDVGVGGGLVYSVSKAKFGYDKDYKGYNRSVSKNFGLSLYATGNYKVAKNVAVNLTVNPDVYLYNYTANFAKATEETKEVCGYESYGVKLGFAFNASVGVSYSF